MKKSLVAILFFVVSMAQAAVPTATIEKARDATVLIAAEGKSETAGGLGTGVVIDPSGLTITNYHVIHRATTVRVFFYDPDNLNYYEADIIGIDPVADLALIQIKVDESMLPLTHLKIEPEKFDIGQSVVAIGHMLGLQWSVTSGTLNHLNRPGKITPYVNVIQHSAQINKGNSGGPLINESGDIVGINTYILLPEGGWTGIAYAIRGDSVEASIDQLKATGKVEYTALKLGLRNMNEFFINAVKNEYPDRKVPTGIFGLMAVGVEEDDYAYKQGVREFDIVVAVNGIPINNLDGLKEVIKEYKSGTIVSLIIIRDGHFRLMDYTLGTIDFDGYLEFYDESIKRQFSDKQRQTPPSPQEEEELEESEELEEQEELEDKEGSEEK